MPDTNREAEMLLIVLDAGLSLKIQNRSERKESVVPIRFDSRCARLMEVEGRDLLSDVLDSLRDEVPPQRW